MHLSHYLRIWPDPERPSCCRVFSTRTGALAVVPDAAVEKARTGGLAGPTADTLTRLDILVPDPEAERRQVLAYLEELNRVNPTLKVSVIVGMGCNFACPYCYEGSLKGADAMDDATAARLVGFVKDRLTQRKTKLTVHFYGGEPLLYRERIRRLAEALQKVAAEKGVAFGFTLITNGSLLTPEAVDELAPLGLTGVKVTLDGPPDLHDRTRPYRSGRGSFADILGNLRAVADRLAVGLGGNITPETWRRFPELLDHLEANGLGPRALGTVKFDPVLRTAGRFANAEHCGGCASFAEPWLVEAGTSLRRELRRRGYRTPKITPSPCMADVDDAFTVNWDGTLTKCVALIGYAEYAVGDLRRGFTEDVQARYGGERWRAESDCPTCPWLPLCFGGCRLLQLQRTGSMAGVDCMKPFWEAALEGLMG